MSGVVCKSVTQSQNGIVKIFNLRRHQAGESRPPGSLFKWILPL